MLMMQESHRAMLRSYGIVIARVMLGALFFLSGLQIALGGMESVNGVAGMIASKGIPLSLLVAILVVIIKVGAGAALMLGFRTGLAAGLLFLFTAGTVVFFHLAPADDIFGMQTALFKNLAIMGGLLYAMAYGPGEGWKLSLDKKSDTVTIG